MVPSGAEPIKTGKIISETDAKKAKSARLQASMAAKRKARQEAAARKAEYKTRARRTAEESAEGSSTLKDEQIAERAAEQEAIFEDKAAAVAAMTHLAKEEAVVALAQTEHTELVTLTGVHQPGQSSGAPSNPQKPKTAELLEG